METILHLAWSRRWIFAPRKTMLHLREEKTRGTCRLNLYSMANSANMFKSEGNLLSLT